MTRRDTKIRELQSGTAVLEEWARAVWRLGCVNLLLSVRGCFTALRRVKWWAIPTAHAFTEALARHHSDIGKPPWGCGRAGRLGWDAATFGPEGTARQMFLIEHLPVQTDGSLKRFTKMKKHLAEFQSICSQVPDPTVQPQGGATWLFSLVPLAKHQEHPLWRPLKGAAGIICRRLLFVANTFLFYTFHRCTGQLHEKNYYQQPTWSHFFTFLIK